MGDLPVYMPQIIIFYTGHHTQASVWLIVDNSGIIAVDLIAIFLSLVRNPSAFSGTSAYLRTSSMVSIGRIVTRDLYRSSINTSPIFIRGISTVLIPAFAAASILYVTPPTGRTSPRTEREPVMATSCRMGIPSIALITAVAMLIDAESPSAPYVPINWIWTSMFLISFPVNFFIKALTFLMDCWAIDSSSFSHGSWRFPETPVAIICPLSPCAGVTSAIMGRTDPASFPVTASPFTRPTRVPSTIVISYSLRCWVISSDT